MIGSSQTPGGWGTPMLAALIKSMRPKQWTKNVFLLAALVFDNKLLVPYYVARASIAFVLFCAVTGAIYIINDLVDIDKDRQHPVKRNRPLPSGELAVSVALSAAIVLVIVSLPLAVMLNRMFGLIVSVYFVAIVLYSFWLKNVVLVDVLVLSAGFVLRVAAGVVIVDAERFSPWLYVCMLFLALFLAISKRRHELVLLADNANAHRSILQEYNLTLLDDMTRLVTSVTAMAYSLYTFSAPNLPQNHTMMLTIPFILYALFRYLYLVNVRGEGGSPEDLIFKDKPLFLSVALWGLASIVILYFA